jgi:tryptophan synthase beta chain
MAAVPDAWYNVRADIPLEIPDDLASPDAAGEIRPQLPAALIRQELSQVRDISIPGEVMDRYLGWRPTPLRRARRLEKALGTPARIYYKYEGGNISGSHKLNSAVAQVYYYAKAGVRRLATGTGAGQWGTALAAAGSMFGVETTAFMTKSSYTTKPYRRVIMEMLGCQVTAVDGNLAAALAAALQEARASDGSTRFCTGSSEGYTLLHQTVIGLETQQQLAQQGERADILVASLGAGSNFGGLAFPFLGAARRTGEPVRAVAVEPAACPKLTRGRYAYDFSDSSHLTPLQKMYTLGSGFATPEIHAGGLRYHATSKIVSALRAAGMIEAIAYTQQDVFQSAVTFARLEGVLPAPEGAHAAHGAIREALACRDQGTARTIVFCLSGHGMYDLAAYDEFLMNRLTDVIPTDAEIEASLARLPEAVS